MRWSRGESSSRGHWVLMASHGRRAQAYSLRRSARGSGGAAQHPQHWSRLDYEGLELFLVAQAHLRALGVRARGEVADAHVEEPLAFRRHHVGRESLRLEAGDDGVGAGLVLERADLDREVAA